MISLPQFEFNITNHVLQLDQRLPNKICFGFFMVHYALNIIQWLPIFTITHIRILFVNHNTLIPPELGTG